MSKDVEFVVRVIADTVLENENYFSELDGVVGDGDFGYSIARGFEKVLQEWDNMDHTLPGNFLKNVSSAIVSAVGGVSGAIWGTAFLRAGMTLGTKTEAEITQEDVIAMFRSAIEGMKKRGKSDLGDKTRSTRTNRPRSPWRKPPSPPEKALKPRAPCWPSVAGQPIPESAASAPWMPVPLRWLFYLKQSVKPGKNKLFCTIA